MTWWKWSRTAASNATADPTINWAEGQSPSSINDSARAEMAAMAKGRGDISGSIATGGTSTAYTVTSYQGFTVLQAELFIAFVPHATNGAVATLNVDGLGAKPLRSQPGSSGDLGAGVLVQGTPYLATYFTSNGGEWILHGFYGNAFNVPIAGSMDYFGTTPPNSNFVFPFGQAVSRTTYATLFGLVSTFFGAGDGSTTFNLPDLRGRVTAGLDNMGGAAAGRIGIVVTDGGTINGSTFSAGGSSTHALTTAEIPVHAHGITDPGHSHTIPTTGNQTLGTQGGGPGIVVGWADSGANARNTGSSTTGISGTNNSGGGNAHAMLQPTVMANKIMRII